MSIPAVTNSVLQSKFDKAVKKLQDKQIIQKKEELVVNTITNYLVGVFKQNKWFRDYLIQSFDTFDNNK